MTPEEHEDPTGWFERLYVASEQRDVPVPWDRAAPNPLLVEWAGQRGLDGRGRRAIVVGCGLGQDSELVAGLGFDTVAFDVAATAVRAARRRFPGSAVEYVVADLLHLPAEWPRAFDLVVESLTVQSLAEHLREQATAAVADLVGPGGTLLVIASRRDEEDGPVQGPPWPLTRAQVEAFASGGLRAVRIEDAGGRWRAEFHRSSL